MPKPETLTMTMRELDRLKVIQAVVDHGLAVWRKRGRPSNNRLSAEREAAALGLIREHYADFGPTLAAEKLREAHGLTLAKETVRRTVCPIPYAA